jgi:hypothetical protein
MSEITVDAGSLLDDEDDDEFDDVEALREWLDQKMAEVESTIDAQEARDDALSTKLDRIEDMARTAEERASRAETVAEWGGLGYHDRIEQVVETLVLRARHADGQASITTSETVAEDHQGNRRRRPGVVDLFDDAVSRRTCRRYLDDLAELRGLSIRSGDRGGYGGGSEQKRLSIDLATFEAAFGEEWDIEELVEEVRA